MGHSDGSEEVQCKVAVVRAHSGVAAQACGGFADEGRRVRHGADQRAPGTEPFRLPPEVARSLALQTAYGAAAMARQEPHSAAELRRRVTSPGGTTEAAIGALESGGFKNLVQQAVEAAAKRSKELAG